MTTLLKSEFLKLRTVRSTAFVLLGMVGLVGLITSGVVPETLSGGLDDDAIRETFAMPAGLLAPYFALVLGALAMTGEFRHGTTNHTFLAAPRRHRVVVAKAVIHTGLGLIVGVLAVGVSIATAFVTAAVIGEAIPAGTYGPAGVIGMVLVSGLYGLLGVAIGTATRSQVTAILVAVLGLSLAEQLLGSFLPALALPSTAAAVLGGMSDLAPPWAGALVLVAYAASIAGLGSRFVLARDIT